VDHKRNYGRQQTVFINPSMTTMVLVLGVWCNPTLTHTTTSSTVVLPLRSSLEEIWEHWQYRVTKMHLSKVDLQNVLEKVFTETPNCACTIISCSAIFRKIVCINQHFNLIDIIFSCDIDRRVPWKKPILKDSVDAGCSNHDTHPDPTVIGSNC
jgi:hypothetical protein